MRVALVTEWFYPDVGGVAAHVVGLAEALARRGHEVVVFTPSGEPLSSCFRVVRLKRLLPVPHAPPVAWDGLSGFDVVHAHHAFAPTPLASIVKAERKRIPCVLTNHTLAPAPHLVTPLLAPLSRLLSKAKAIIAVSRAAARFISRIYRGPIYVIPNGVDTRRFKPSKEPCNEPIALFVGRLVHRKGVHVLIRAFERVQREVKEAKLVVAGRGPLRRPLEELARRLGVRAVFLGFVPHEELPSTYRRATVLAMPSLYAEAFGITALEAMASGLPVVASRCGGLAEVVVHGETGLLVRPGDVGELAEALTLLLSDLELARSVGASARRLAVARYDWDVVAGMVEGVYREVLALRSLALAAP